MKQSGTKSLIPGFCLCVYFMCSVGLVCFSPSAPAAPLPEGSPDDVTVHMVGNAHVDLAWHWLWEETVFEVYRHTFPFLLILAVGVLMITYIPDMSLGILKLLGKYEAPELLAAF